MTEQTFNDAQPAVEISQHIGWLKQYLAGMTEHNWRDMRMLAGRQLDALAAAQPPAAPVETTSNQLAAGTGPATRDGSSPERSIPLHGSSADSALLEKLADMIERGQCGDVWDINDVSEADHARLPALLRRLA